MELARRQRDSRNLSTLVAASSADDITLVSKVPLHKPPVGSTLATDATPPSSHHSYSKSMDVIPLDGAGSWENQNGESGQKVSIMVVNDEKKPPEDKRLDHLKRLQPLSRSQEFNVQAVESGYKRPKTIESLPSEVHVLRMKYESPTPPHIPPTPPHIPPTSPPTSPPTRTTPSLQPNGGKSGRCNSVGNSDSGRESMILETDV